MFYRLIILFLVCVQVGFAQTKPDEIQRVRLQNIIEGYCKDLINLIKTGDVKYRVALEDRFANKQNQVYNDFGFANYDSKMSFSAYLTKLIQNRKNLTLSYNLPSDLSTLPLYTFISPNGNRRMWLIPVQKRVNGNSRQNVFFIGAQDFKIYNVYKDLPAGAERIYFTQTIRLTSQPSAAGVYLYHIADGFSSGLFENNPEILGTTPLDLKLREGKTYGVSFQKEGYKEAFLSLSGGSGSQHVVLVPKCKPLPPRKPLLPSDKNQVKIKGQTYETVTIGTQTWLAENLNMKIGGSSCYDDDPANCEKYGRLYSWEAAKKVADRTPGWHLPTDEEWDELCEALGGTKDCDDYGHYGHIGLPIGTYLKKGGKSGLNLLLAGLGGNRNSGGYFSVLGQYGCFWSASPHAGGAWYREVTDSGRSRDAFFRNSSEHIHTDRFSVRLIKDK